MKRGRKQDDTLPPSRSREIQRAFRQRRSDYIKGLEDRVEQLEAEVDEALSRLGEPLRYTAADIVAARAASRKKQKNKSKHNLNEFLDPGNLAHSMSRPGSEPPSELIHSSIVNSLGDTSASSSGSSYYIRPNFAANTKYVMRDDSYYGSIAHESPEYRPDSFPLEFGTEMTGEVDRRGNLDSPHSPDRSKFLFHPWDPECNAPRRRSKSPQSIISLTSNSISPPEYHQGSNFGMYLNMNPITQSHNTLSRQISESFPSEKLKIPHSCGPIPGLLSDTPSQFRSIPEVNFEVYKSASPKSNPAPYEYPEPGANSTGHYDSCSYPLTHSGKSDSSPKISHYPPNNSVPIYRSKNPANEQKCEAINPLSSHLAIVGTRAGPSVLDAESLF
ncbi:hypothetical protein BY996DRAFT_4577199 [Phakopsora pachyrhizi]|uniref:Expressed protein n=1 Tax=Phakopsora pachyrhizi TaxID=170000 RepID=A0AAV0AD83_PHAPC|nr:hypothetical protein BY996DRAFT_4577199 [Phakopsora pachyrhizi]CAH7665947.1 expressed protein [Phakopsora pachyrhizi]